jgi:hypothetical protein
MDFYVISLAAGATGLAAMAAVGLSHAGSAGHTAHGGHASHGGHAHGGHDIGHAAHGGHHAGPVSHAGHPSHAGEHGASWMQSLLSPRVLFALMIGFGSGGLLAEPLGAPWRLGAAILGAAAFEALLVGPVWRFLFRFESTPAVTLESAIEDEARAVTGFDANGQGLVAVEVDGQIVQLLATLTPDDRTLGVRVRSGDLLRVAEVDAARGRCIVRIGDR